MNMMISYQELVRTFLSEPSGDSGLIAAEMNQDDRNMIASVFARV